jgi:hypothetical protein
MALVYPDSAPHNINQHTAEENPPASNEKFTSRKLSWMNCITFTSTLTPFEKLVAIVIMQTINETTEDWAISDEAIAVLCGKPGAIRSVKRARRRLRKGGWLMWKRRPNAANLYRLNYCNVMSGLDARREAQANLRELRAKRRAEVTPESLPEVTPESPLHTRGTHSERKESSEEVRVRVRELNAKLDEMALANDARAERRLPLMRVIGGGR